MDAKQTQGPLSYVVEMETGVLWKRHIDHLLPAGSSSRSVDMPVEELESDVDDFVDLPSPQEPHTREVTPEAMSEATPEATPPGTPDPPTSGEDTVHTPATTPVVIASRYRFRDRPPPDYYGH